ncbi:MAG TPA: LysR family transcriptional regulator [Alphaproteobacteria bacterium]|nr:LysR family transcriptional regulator [Alphaproteobacteria bacterium]
MNSLPSNWDDYRVFAAIVAEGSLSAAARRLGLSQPTMGRRLQALERSLGAKLLDRVDGAYVLTPRGAELLPLVEQLVEAGEAIERARPDFAETATGMVRVATGPWNSRFLARRLPELLADLPGIELQILSGNVFADLARREADIAIRNRRPGEGKLVRRALPDPAYALFASRDYVTRNPAALTMGRTQDCRWISLDESQAHAPSVRWIERHLQRSAHVRCNNSANVLDAILGSAGIGIAPCWVAADEPNLVQLTAPLEDFDTDGLWLVVHEDLRNRPRVRLAADRIAALFQRYRNLLQPEGAG